NTGPLTAPGDRRSERNPAWLESVLRRSRSTEPVAGPGQVDTAENEKLRVEAMGQKGVSRVEKAGCPGQIGLEHRQIGPRPVADVSFAGTAASLTGPLVQQLWSV